MKLIIFDYDGVIVDSFAMLVRIYLDISKEFNLNLPEHPEYFRDLFELDWRETLRKIGITKKEDIERQLEVYREGLKRYSEDIKPYPDMPHVLSALSQKYTLAIATNNIREELDYRLSRYDLARYFSAVYTAEDGELKPSPDMLLKCMARFNAAPGETAFVGDMDGDIWSGKAAKVKKMIAVTYGYHLKHRLKDADIIIESPKELLKVI